MTNISRCAQDNTVRTLRSSASSSSRMRAVEGYPRPNRTWPSRRVLRLPANGVSRLNHVHRTSACSGFFFVQFRVLYLVTSCGTTTEQLSRVQYTLLLQSALLLSEPQTGPTQRVCRESSRGRALGQFFFTCFPSCACFELRPAGRM